MRRMWAALIVVLMTGSALLPAWAGASATTVPACCRRNGKHHCHGQQASPESGAVLRAFSSCPMRGCAQLTHRVDATLISSPGPAIALLTWKESGSTVQSATSLPPSTQHERGPPSIR